MKLVLSDLPIACSLDAADLSQRVAEIGALGREALVGAEVAPGRAVLRFASGVHDRVAAIVAAEAKCCPFLDLRVTDEPDAVVLEIGAPADAQPVLEEFAAAFRALPSPRSAR
jgi:hypothetical protein